MSAPHVFGIWWPSKNLMVIMIFCLSYYYSLRIIWSFVEYNMIIYEILRWLSEIHLFIIWLSCVEYLMTIHWISDDFLKMIRTTEYCLFISGEKRENSSLFRREIKEYKYINSWIHFHRIITSQQSQPHIQWSISRDIIYQIDV